MSRISLVKIPKVKGNSDVDGYKEYLVINDIYDSLFNTDIRYLPDLSFCITERTPGHNRSESNTVVDAYHSLSNIKENIEGDVKLAFLLEKNDDKPALRGTVELSEVQKQVHDGQVTLTYTKISRTLYIYDEKGNKKGQSKAIFDFKTRKKQ